MIAEKNVTYYWLNTACSASAFSITIAGGLYEMIRSSSSRLSSRWSDGLDTFISMAHLEYRVRYPDGILIGLTRLHSSAQKYGTQQTNIAEPSGSVMGNTRESTAVAHPIWRRSILKAPSLPHSILLFGTKMS